MTGNFIRIFASGVTLVGALAASAPSHAIPAFARQTGKACATCHFQHYPVLNDFGMEFKSGGFVDRGKQGVLKGKGMSLPEILNASIFTKIRYQKNSGADLPGMPTAASGELQFPDEFALLFGGRVAENIGFMLEGQLAAPGSFVAGFKLPMMFPIGKTGMKVGFVPYTTDALGASYGFELLSTGAVRNVRIAEHRNEISAQQYVGTATAASGGALVLWDPKFYINFSKWSPNHAATANGLANGNPSSSYVRAVWTPTFGDWSLGIGAQGWFGESKVDDGLGVCGGTGLLAGTAVNCRTEATAFDVQAQGVVAGLPLGVYLTHARADGTSAGQTVNLFNNQPNTKTATAIAAELGILPGKATLIAAYRNADNGRNPTPARSDTDNAWTLGGTYQIAQNVQLQINHSHRTKDNGYQGSDPTQSLRGTRLTTFMLSAGF
ncbi:MAG: hypothetical protein Fur0039_18060 [Rhodocyclaceae bacterium]